MVLLPNTIGDLPMGLHITGWFRFVNIPTLPGNYEILHETTKWKVFLFNNFEGSYYRYILNLQMLNGNKEQKHIE